MSLLLPFPVAKKWRRHYIVSRIFLYIILFSVGVLFVMNILFPTLNQSFDFRAPGSSKNTIQNPRSDERVARTNGKIEKDGIMRADTTVLGDFSLLTVTTALEKDSSLPETLDFTVRRSYQGFFAPTGEPVTDFPQETLYVVGETYYALRQGTLFPFVSKQAYTSRFPEERAVRTDSSLFTIYPVSEEWLGFRIGSLLGNTTGVFIVMSETEVRPVGSAEIFLSLGYSFENVISVSEEELGLYKRGRILLLGATHPTGTLFFDQDTSSYFIRDQDMKRPLLPGVYRDFLLRQVEPILVSSQASETSAHCTLVPVGLGRSLSCRTSVSALPQGFGNDFEISLRSPQSIDINTLTLSFTTEKTNDTMLLVLSKIKQRLLARFGGTE